MAIKITTNKKHKLLTKACFEDDVAEVKKLIEESDYLADIWTDEYYPMSIAFEHNNVEIIRLLAEKGMPLYEYSKSAYYHATNDKDVPLQYIFGLWDPDNEDACLAMLDYADEVNTPSSNNPLCSLAQLDDKYTSEKSDLFLSKLINKGANVDLLMDCNLSVLHFIAAGKNSKYTDALIRLSKNVDVAPLEEAYYTPLFLAVNSPTAFYIIPIKALLEMGADPNHYNPVNQRSILDNAMKHRKKKKYLNRNGKLDEIVDLLISYGAKTYQQLVADGDIKE